MAEIVQIHEGVSIRRYAIEKAVIRIGRHPDNDIFVDEKVVSMEHAQIKALQEPDENGRRRYYIEDLESTNCTFVNDQKITRTLLNDNDLIRVGWSTFKFVDTQERAAEKTHRIYKSWIPGVYYTKD